MDLDFSQDKEGWEALSEIQRKSALWIYSMFFFGEDSVDRQPLPLHRRRPEGGAEVLPRDPAGRRGPPRRLLPPLLQRGDRRRRRHRRRRSPSPSSTSAGATGRSSTGSTRWPTSCAATARCRSSRRRSPSTTWSSRRAMAQPGQHFIEDFFVREGTMPGFSAGMENVSRDEQRHIGFGVKVLERAARRVRRVQGRRRRAADRGDAVALVGVHPARTGTASTPAATASSSRRSPPGASRRSR